MKQTVIYVRRSLDTKKQKNSINVQISICKELAKRHSWVIHNIFNEGKCSARKTQIDERPLLSELLSQVNDGTIGRVIVFKRDRLARNVEQYLQIYKTFKAAGVELCFSADNEPPEFNGPIGEFVEALLAGVAEHEGENIVRRLVESRRSLSKNGKWMSGHPPVGYKSQKGNLSKKPKDEPFITAIFEEFVKTDGKTLKEIKTKMRHHPSINKRQFKFKKIITNPIYIGKLVQNLEGEVYEYPELLDKLIMINNDLWEQANQKLALFPPEEEDEEKERYAPLLSSLVICGKCKGRLKIGTKNYSCPTCTMNKVNIQRLDQFVIKTVIRFLEAKANHNKKELISHIKTQFLKGPRKKLQETEQKVNQLEIDIYKQMKQHANQSLAVHTKSQINKLKEAFKEHEELNKSIHHINQSIIFFTRNLTMQKIDIEGLSVQEKRNIVGLIDSVSVYKDQVAITLVSNRKKDKD